MKKHKRRYGFKGKRLLDKSLMKSSGTTSVPLDKLPFSSKQMAWILASIDKLVDVDLSYYNLLNETEESLNEAIILCRPLLIKHRNLLPDFARPYFK